jgi:hypothetical protein
MLSAAMLATGLLLSVPVAAAPITYNEGAADALSDDFNLPTQLGALDLGLNTIMGRISCSGISCSQDDDEDNFRVTLAAGLQITGISFEVRRFTASGGTDQKPGGRFKKTLGTLLLNNPFAFDFSSDVSATSVFSGAAPGAGELWLAVEDFSLGTPSVQSWEYTVGIQVAASESQPVPEPATLALVGAALLTMTGLSTTRRRKGA